MMQVPAGMRMKTSQETTLKQAERNQSSSEQDKRLRDVSKGAKKEQKYKWKNKAINNSKKISKLFEKSYYIIQLSCKSYSHNNLKML